MRKKEIIPIEVPETPITDDTFIKQGWERYDITESDDDDVDGDDGDDDDEFVYYWLLPLPIDNPDEFAPCLISSPNDEWDVLELNEGEYIVELADANGIGICLWEEEIEILYRALTRMDIYENNTDKVSVKKK